LLELADGVTVTSATVPSVSAVVFTPYTMHVANPPAVEHVRDLLAAEAAGPALIAMELKSVAVYVRLN
jgi:hypothetical protein